MSDQNSYQAPSQPLRPGKVANEERRAYVFYATNAQYALAVLVFVTLLRRSEAPCECDIILLHFPLANSLLRKIREAGIIARPSTTPRKLSNSYYRDCLLKLRIFELVEYDRIVFADADAIPLRGLEGLFTLPMDQPIAAPRAYWIPDRMWTTALMVVKPSMKKWQRLTERFERLDTRREFDMDLINAEFADEIQSLPEEFFALDSEWEKADRPGYFAAVPDILERLLVVHFSVLEKPWVYPINAVRRLRPEASPAFYELRRQWRNTMKEILRGCSPALRFRMGISIWLRRMSFR